MGEAVVKAPLVGISGTSCETRYSQVGHVL